MTTETATTEKLLTFVLVKQKTLTEIQIRRMFQLMEQNYDHMNYEMFLSDLNSKCYVGILYDAHQTIQGFTTFAINPKGTGAVDYSIIFSGDTIISPDHWGTQEMMRGWGTSVGRIIAKDPSKKWYWFLLSKGHRTYMYLPLFFNEYHPSVNGQKDEELLEILNSTAAKLYDPYFHSTSGTIRFTKKIGELKPHLAQTTFEKQNKPHIKFFLERNPGFHNGDELVCITRLHPDNVKGYGKRYILEGMSANEDL